MDIVYAIYDPAQFLKDAYLFREFLHRFGRETMQDSVAVEIGGRMHFISHFENQKENLALISVS